MRYFFKKKAGLEATRTILTLLFQATPHSSNAVGHGDQEEKQPLLERVTWGVRLRACVDDPTT